MRNLIIGLTLAGIVLGSGCRKKETPVTTTNPSSDVLARFHFTGTTGLATGTNAVELREICALPESQKFEEQTLQKLAHAPRIFYGGKINTEEDDRGATLIRPLLDDVIRHESFLQVREPANKPVEWTLLMQLPPDRLKAWGNTLLQLAQLWKLGAVTHGTLEGFNGSEIKREGAPNLVHWTEAGQWFVLSIGSEGLTTTTEALHRIKTIGRPVPTLSTNWIEAELDLPRLTGALELSPKFKWPHAEIAVAPVGENMRTIMRLVFPEPVTGPLEPWHIPTNVINDPLISFTAMRGIAPLLENSMVLQKLGLKPIPNELYCWAQSQVTFQSFLAFPQPDVTNTLIRIGERAPTVLPEDWQKRGLAQISWQPTNHQVFWKQLPLITPNLKPARDAGVDFIVGGIFPPVPLTNPPPTELLAQLKNKQDLLYYDWEITQGRLQQWRIMAQLFAVIANQPQLSTNTAGLPWLIKAETHLGNTITEITAKSAREWSLVRKSHIGFTGVELVALTRWLESTNFPRLSWDLPEHRLALPERRMAPGGLPGK